MRELLFRGQTRKKGQKVYMNGQPVAGNWEYGGIFQGQGCYSVLYTYDPIAKKPIYTDTIGQFTGFTDENSTRIFEDDLLMKNELVYVVEWIDGCFYAVQKSPPTGMVTSIRHPLHELVGNGTVVIGNIHDNPELLVNHN